jgi:hypothetical protein
MAPSGMLRRVTLVRTDVSEELSASFIRATRTGELGTTLAVTCNRRTLRRNTKSVLTRAKRRNIPEDTIRHCHSLGMDCRRFARIIHCLFQVPICL